MLGVLADNNDLIILWVQKVKDKGPGVVKSHLFNNAFFQQRYATDASQDDLVRISFATFCYVICKFVIFSILLHVYKFCSLISVFFCIVINWLFYFIALNWWDDVLCWLLPYWCLAIYRHFYVLLLQYVIFLLYNHGYWPSSLLLNKWWWWLVGF